MRSVIFEHASGLLARLLAVVSVLYLLRGHHAPGGGFVGGLLLSTAIVLRAQSHGPAEARALLGLDPRMLAGAGLAIVVASAGAGLVAEGVLLAPLELGRVPAVGPIGTVLAFDAGVYLVVAGTALAILLGLVEEDR